MIAKLAFPSTMSGGNSTLVSLTYVSFASRPMSRLDLAAIQRVGMRRNAQLDITGSLLYVSGLFVHTLEGPRDAVISVYMKIRADSRHRDAVMVYMAPQDERVYSTAFELTTATEEMLSAFPPLQVWGRAVCVSLPYLLNRDMQ